MPDALTITREWFELLEGLPTVQSRWNVLTAAACYAFDGREPGKEDLSAIEKSIFMNMRSKIQLRKRLARFYTKHKNEPLESNVRKNTENRMNLTLESNAENPSSNQHMNTDISPSSNSKLLECSPTGKNSTARRVFKVPTLEEVKAYCKERHNAVDAEQFHSYYESVGWVVGHGNKMRDWHKAVQYWERSQYQRQNQRKPKRDYSGI